MSTDPFDPASPGGLDDETARLLQIARTSSGEVSSGQRRALHAAVLAAAAATATAAAAEAAAATGTAKTAAATAGTNAAATATATGGVVGKTLVGGLVGVVLGGVIVGTSVLLEEPPRRSAPAQAATASADRAPLPAATAIFVAPPTGSETTNAPPLAASSASSFPRAVVSGRSTTADEPRAEPSASAVAPPAPPGTSLLEESAALREVSKALAEGKPDDALRLLEAGPRTGRLDEERTAARIIALCNAGRSDEARPLRATFAAAHPQSNHRSRIASACGDGAD